MEYAEESDDNDEVLDESDVNEEVLEERDVNEEVLDAFEFRKLGGDLAGDGC